MLAAATVPLGSLPASARTAGFSACLVTAAGAESGASFDQLAYLGLLKAERAGVTGRAIRSKSPPDNFRDVRSCVRRGADITIGVGLQLAGAIDAVASEFPRDRFAIVDVDVTMLKHRPGNVVGLLFREQQAGYLVGYAAGLWAKTHGGKAVGSVGGLAIPPVDRYIAGFQFGAKKADPGIKTLNDYSQDFVQQPKCRKQALHQIAQGSVVELQVAGRCGLGVLAAAHEKGVFGIGADTDQGSLGPWVMTSAVKRADIAVYDTIRSARAGTLQGGGNVVLGVRANGVGYGTWSAKVPASIRRAVAKQLELLEAGKLKGIPTTVE